MKCLCIYSIYFARKNLKKYIIIIIWIITTIPHEVCILYVYYYGKIIYKQLRGDKWMFRWQQRLWTHIDSSAPMRATQNIEWYLIAYRITDACHVSLAGVDLQWWKKIKIILAIKKRTEHANAFSQIIKRISYALFSSECNILVLTKQNSIKKAGDESESINWCYWDCEFSYPRRNLDPDNRERCGSPFSTPTERTRWCSAAMVCTFPDKDTRVKLIKPDDTKLIMNVYNVKYKWPKRLCSIQLMEILNVFWCRNSCIFKSP